MPVRRDLKFSNWDDVLTELDQLAKGHDAAGKWNLAQTCRHLDDWLRFPMDGFPVPPWFVRIMMWGMRITVGRRLFQKILKTGEMSTGNPTMPETVYPPGESEAEAVRHLRETIQRFRDYTGQIHESPLFGKMDKDQAEKLQLVHFSHHLSFLLPKNAS